MGTIATPDGKKQVTINGMPVYYYAKDQAAGDITGQGVGGVWYLVAPSGEMITAPPPDTSRKARPTAAARRPGSARPASSNSTAARISLVSGLSMKASRRPPA